MNQTTRVLVNIPSTEPAAFFELIQALGDDAPEKGDRDAWRELFQTIEALERQELVEVDRHDGKIESLILTSLGAERAREALRGN